MSERPSASAASGRFLLRMDPILHQRIRRQARRQGVSINRWCLDRLAHFHGDGEWQLPDPLPAALRRASQVHGPQLAGVAIFGPWARGEENELRAIDLLIALRPGSELRRSLYSGWDGGDPLRAGELRVEPHIVVLPVPSDRPTGFWAELATDGVVLLDQEFQLSRALARVRHAVARGEIQRRHREDVGYWVQGEEGIDAES